jgi:hypothetical protein
LTTTCNRPPLKTIIAMADLYHLLDGVEEQSVASEEEVAERERLGEEEEESEGGEWKNADDDDGTGATATTRRATDVIPAALEEAARQRRRKGRADGDEAAGAGTPDAADDEAFDLQNLWTSAAAAGSTREGEEGRAGELPYEKLLHRWSQELHSPELLPFDQETVQTICEALERQESTMDDFLEADQTGNANMDALFHSLLRIDSDRVKFLLADLLKQRLQKIEAHPLYMRECLDRMSDSEVRNLTYLVRNGLVVVSVVACGSFIITDDSSTDTLSPSALFSRSLFLFIE